MTKKKNFYAKRFDSKTWKKLKTWNLNRWKKRLTVNNVREKIIKIYSLIFKCRNLSLIKQMLKPHSYIFIIKLKNKCKLMFQKLINKTAYFLQYITSLCNVIIHIHNLSFFLSSNLIKQHTFYILFSSTKFLSYFIALDLNGKQILIQREFY